MRSGWWRKMERTSSERYMEFMEDSCCSQFCMGPNPWMARYVYGLMFLIMNLLAWAVRDYGHGALSELGRLKECQGGRDCLGTEGVLRVSLGCFIFFIIMFISTMGTARRNDPRDSWHSGWWLAKSLLSIVLMVLPFFVPSAFIQLYGKLAHLGAGVFLVIQLISINSFITWLDDCCQSDEYTDRCRCQVMVISVVAYVACLLGIVMMYVWYVPKLSCSLNLVFITWTVLLIIFMTSVSLHHKVNGGCLTPGLMGLYIVFICWCAIRSEPPTETCNRKAEAATRADWLTIISFIIALLAIVIATFSTGIDSKAFQFMKKEAQTDEQQDDVPYGYGFFHFVFATGAMYFAMLLIGWNAHHTMQKWTIDVGWASTWVRVANEWLAAFVYIWMLVAPLVWKKR